MRQDQIDRLQDLSEAVSDVFLEEADPENWNGAGQPLAGLTDKARGNRYWDKKNAIQTGALLARIHDLRDRHSGEKGAIPPEAEAEEDISRFEKQAKEMLHVVSSR